MNKGILYHVEIRETVYKKVSVIAEDEFDLDSELELGNYDILDRQVLSQDIDIEEIGSVENE